MMNGAPLRGQSFEGSNAESFWVERLKLLSSYRTVYVFFLQKQAEKEREEEVERIKTVRGEEAREDKQVERIMERRRGERA